jgi:RNA polymerase sigma factor (sigma-70 family)
VTTAPLPDRGTQQEAAGAAGGLFERHGRMVYGVCRAMLRDVHEAEDATQQVFLSAYQALLRGADVREPGSWLATIARNECRARMAAGMRRPLSVADEDLDSIAVSGDEQDRRVQLLELRTALEGLPERQREAVVLRYLYGLSYAEVATALGVSRPAMEALLFRARRSLRIRLRPVIGAALVVPSVVREELTAALPGFGGAGSGLVAVGATSGILAKLTAGSAGVKTATAVVAVSTVGAVGTVPLERVPRSEGTPNEQRAVVGFADVVATPQADGAADPTELSGRNSRSAGTGGHHGRGSSGSRETERDSSGRGSESGREGGSPDPVTSSGHGGGSSGHDTPPSSGPGPGTNVETDDAPTATDSSGSGGGGIGSSGHGHGGEPMAVPSEVSSGSGSGGESSSGSLSGSGSGSSGHSAGDEPDD